MNLDDLDSLLKRNEVPPEEEIKRRLVQRGKERETVQTELGDLDAIVDESNPNDRNRVEGEMGEKWVKEEFGLNGVFGVDEGIDLEVTQPSLSHYSGADYNNSNDQRHQVKTALFQRIDNGKESPPYILTDGRYIIPIDSHRKMMSSTPQGAEKYYHFLSKIPNLNSEYGFNVADYNGLRGEEVSKIIELAEEDVSGLITRGKNRDDRTYLSVRTSVINDYKEALIFFGSSKKAKQYLRHGDNPNKLDFYHDFTLGDEV